MITRKFEMDLSSIPLILDGKNKGKKDWKNSKGCIIYAKYKDFNEKIEIFDVIIRDNNKSTYLRLKYNDVISDEISCSSVSNGYITCLFDSLPDEMIGYKYNIGQIIHNDKQNFVITNRFEKTVIIKNGEIRKYKYYNYRCLDCGYDKGEIEEGNITAKYGCSCCTGKTVVPGINDIPTTDPWMINYFQGGYEEAKLYTSHSNKKIYPKCPDCGKVSNKKKSINVINRNHSIGCSCGDGISYPEKFIYKLLIDNNINFIKELSSDNFEWCGKYRYDFYLIDYNVIIETHGLQHYEDTTGWNQNTNTLEKQQEIDADKYNLAMDNNISDYIILDCRYSNQDYIIHSIKKSDINKYINLNNYDFTKCAEFAVGNLLKEICVFFNKNPKFSTIDIGKIYKLNSNTIRKYLKEGTKLGFCNYDSDAARKKAWYKEPVRKPVKVFKNNNLLGIFKSRSYVAKVSLDLFGVKLYSSCICDVCNGVAQQHNGFYFENATVEEYENYIA